MPTEPHNDTTDPKWNESRPDVDPTSTAHAHLIVGDWTDQGGGLSTAPLLSTTLSQPELNEILSAGTEPGFVDHDD